MGGTLYVVSTPIGNLDDITLRALRVLREVDLIAAEDTRVTRKLLGHHDIQRPMISYHQHSRGARLREIVRVLQDGKAVALVADAGTPGISDPGHDLVKLCIAEGIRVEPIPGPTALIAALVISGLDTRRFAFGGFPPRRTRDKHRFFADLADSTSTNCIYEAPNRLLDTLSVINAELPDRQIAVVREVTKRFEEVFRGTAAEAVAHFSAKAVKGEIVVVISGDQDKSASRTEADDVVITERLTRIKESGRSERDAIRQCAEELGAARKRVYSLAIRLRADRDR